MDLLHGSCAGRWLLLVAMALAGGGCSLVSGFSDFVVVEGGDGDSDADGDGDGDTDIDGCVPQCTGRDCGPDGCGGQCGRGCNPPAFCNEDGQCEGPCDPDCVDRECGPDGCGGQCGPECPSEARCNEYGHCVASCDPECGGRECGIDGCGGQCPPGCDEGSFCNDEGRCQNGCVPNCEGRDCGPDGCDGDCGSCPADQYCDADYGYCFESSCMPGSRAGAPCRPDQTCDGGFECLRPDFAPGPGVCASRCEDGSSCPASSDGGMPLCLDLGDGSGSWCVFSCDPITLCPCEVRCAHPTGDPALGVCYP